MILNRHVNILTIFFMIITICIASGCGGGGGGSTVSSASVSGEEEKSEPIPFDYTVTGPVKEKGDRLLGISVELDEYDDKDKTA